jgi:hypothetical protein
LIFFEIRTTIDAFKDGMAKIQTDALKDGMAKYKLMY